MCSNIATMHRYYREQEKTRPRGYILYDTKINGDRNQNGGWLAAYL